MTTTQPTPLSAQPITSQLPSPQLPTPNPQIPLDPTNPLIWIILLTALLSNLDEPINAIANLLKQLNTILKHHNKTK